LACIILYLLLAKKNHGYFQVGYANQLQQSAFLMHLNTIFLPFSIAYY
jgi:hypothetical protein